jgi:hypothetical protein
MSAIWSDHNHTVAHSSSWYEPDDPLDDIPDFTRSDFNLPEHIELKCPMCGEVLKHCGICDNPFDPDERYLVVCGNSANAHNGHICYNCWDGLPEGKQ